MAGKRKSILLTIGISLMSGLLIIPVIAGCVAYELPRHYYSQATVEIKPLEPTFYSGPVPYDPSVGDPAASRALQEVQAAMAPYGKEAEIQQVRQTDLYELGIWDRDPMAAARKANEAAAALQRNHPGGVQVWEPAEPALMPGRPHIFWYMAFAFGLGLLSFISGLALFFAARGNSRGDSAALSQFQPAR